MAERTTSAHQRERAVFRLGAGPIDSLSWSPDGSRLALGGGRGVEVIARDGTTIWRSEGRTERVRTVAWSPDGARIASVEHDGALRVWGADAGRELHQHAAPPGPPRREWSSDARELYRVAWSPDGRELAWSQRDVRGTVQVHEVDTWRQLRTRELGAGPCELAWAPNGRWLWAAAGYSFQVLDASTLTTAWTVPTASMRCSWSPDSRRLAGIMSGGSLLFVWDATTGKELGTAAANHLGRCGVAWAPDGRSLAIGGHDTVALLGSAELRELGRLTGHTGSVSALAFAPTGGVLASGAGDGTVRLWDVSNLVPEHPTTERTGRAAAYLALQARTVGRQPRSAAPVERWVPTGLPGAGSAPYCLGHLAGVGSAIDLFPDDRHLVSHTDRDYLVKWSLETGSATWSTKLPYRRGNPSVRASPDGSRLAIAVNHPVGQIHDGATGTELGRGPAFQCAAWAPDGRLLASGGWGDDVQVWDPATGDVHHVLPVHPTVVRDLRWNPDGRRLAAVDGSGVVRVWAIEPDRVTLRWQSPNRWDSAWGVAWAPDGTRLASTAGHTICVWAPDTGELVTECRGHTNSTYAVAWSPDGRLASTSIDATVRVWNPATGAELACFRHPNIHDTFGLSWASSGAFLVAGSTLGAIVWDTRHLLATPSPPLPVPAGAAAPLPVALSGLSSALGTMHRMALHPPLSALRDTLALAAGQGPPPGSALSALGEHPAVAKLRALNWPEPARRGLAAHLLRDVPHPEAFAPPAELTPTELPRALEGALADATDGAPEPPPLSAGAVRAALDALSDHALSLLRAVGHRAVATDPGLVARVVASAGRAPSAPPKVGRGSGSRSGGSAVGSFGGAERAGVSSRGDWRSVAPSQWALPVDVFAAKARRGEVLFRSARSARPDDRSPVVVVLDVSPATWGPVGAAARGAAVSVLEARWRAGAGGWIVASGGEQERVWEVRSPGDWAAIWSVRAEVPGDGARALRTAEQVRRGAGWARGSVLVLSHVWFGIGVPRVGRVAAVLVRPPGGRGSGPRSWADHWMEVAPEPQHTAKAAETLLAQLSG